MWRPSLQVEGNGGSSHTIEKYIHVNRVEKVRVPTLLRTLQVLRLGGLSGEALA